MPRQHRNGTQRKITVSPEDDRLLQEMADFYQIPLIEMVVRCFRRGLPIERQSYLERSGIQAEIQSAQIMRSLLARLSAGEYISDIELVTAAHDADVEVETLKQIRDCLNQKKANGSTVN